MFICIRRKTGKGHDEPRLCPSFQTSYTSFIFQDTALISHNDRLFQQKQKELSLYRLCQKLNMANDYTGKHALYLGQTENQHISPLYDLSMYTYIFLFFFWSEMALFTESLHVTVLMV